MKENRLNIVAVEHTREPVQNLQNSTSLVKKRREEAAAKFERLWRIHPEKFDPMRNCMERERIARIWTLILEYLNPNEKQVADLGCGGGVLAKRLCDAGAIVSAVDIANNALKIVEKLNCKNLKTIKDYVPRTLLKDDFYDLAVSTELIANLPADEFRLYFSELSRIIKPSGKVVCSTPLDISSEDALQRFAALAETEFRIEKWVFSHHLLYIRIYDFLAAPSRFVEASKDPENRQRELSERTGLSHWWFQMNSTAIPATFWRAVGLIVNPIFRLFQQSHAVMNVLEKITAAIWSDTGISHVIFIGERRPIMQTPKEEELPQERKHRKQVWE